MLLTVSEIAKITIINAKKIKSFPNNKEKKAKSGITDELDETATKPVNPIKKTIGIIIKKEKNKLFFKISLFFAAYTLCQLPWWNKLVAATAIKKVRPAV